MTPHARLAQLHQELASAYAELAAAEPDEWIDQTRSPLGRRLHCQLVRDGVLKGKHFRRRVLVTKAELDRYITSIGKDPPSDPDDTLLREAGLGRRNHGSQSHRQH